MPASPAEALFERLHAAEALRSLIGTAEDTDLDCKEWRGDDKTKRMMLAKAVCGFANGDGGVVVLGMVANGNANRDIPDLIRNYALIEKPRRGESSGAGDDTGRCGTASRRCESGLPHRSKLDWKFYLRSGSSTQNMPLTVLADRFGRRPHAELRAIGINERFEELPGVGVRWGRTLEIFVFNVGRGIARLPALMLAKDCEFAPLHHPFVTAQDYL